MAANFDKEAKDILLTAKKMSIGQIIPLVKEELIFLAFIKHQHPIWIIIRDHFCLSENRYKNIVADTILRNKLDDPEIDSNQKNQTIYFKALNKLAQKKASNDVDAIVLFNALFLTKNAVVECFELHDIPKNVVLNKLDHIIQNKIIDSSKPSDPIQTQRPTKRKRNKSNHCSDLGELNKSLGRNLIKVASQGKLDPVYYRDDEIQTTIEILCRRKQNNPMLIGYAGVGKTAIVEEIARLIQKQDVPLVMKDKVIVEISLTSMVAGTIYRGQFEEEIQKLIDYCKQNPNCILFIDEIHMLVGTGGEAGTSDAANIFKPALARGEIRCIGATTITEYKKHIAPDKALSRRFHSINVKEPTVSQTKAILKKVKSHYETFHNVEILDETVDHSVELADKYIKNKYFPGKAIDLLDHACAKEILELHHDSTIRPEEVAMIIAKQKQIPLTKLLASDATDSIRVLENRLKEKVMGQDRAIKKLVDRLKLTRMGMDMNPSRPEGVFLFAGPTGVGKTELTKSLTTALFGDESQLVYLDMNDYQTPGEISGLLDKEDGLLISTIRNNPCSIVLFDEIEKANTTILNTIIQISQKGMLKDQCDEEVSFRHAIVVMTTNVGSAVMGSAQIKKVLPKNRIIKAQELTERLLEDTFSPRLLNGIDDVILFEPVSDRCVKKIVEDKIEIIKKRVRSKGIELHISPSVISFIANESYSHKNGAKYVNKQIEKKLLVPLSDLMLKSDKKKIRVQVSKKKIVFR